MQQVKGRTGKRGNRAAPSESGLLAVISADKDVAPQKASRKGRKARAGATNTSYAKSYNDHPVPASHLLSALGITAVAMPLPVR